MGLDMYLIKTTRITKSYMEREKKIDNPYRVNFYHKGKKIEPRDEWETWYLERKIADWRKANAIHGWFVKNVQDGKDDCNRYEVTKDQLLQLYKLCKKVLKEKDTEVSKELLPVQKGAFFGQYEYDDWYYEYIQNTVDNIFYALDDYDGQYDTIYYDSWW